MPKVNKTKEGAFTVLLFDEAIQHVVVVVFWENPEISPTYLGSALNEKRAGYSEKV
jgi:hypothetical protein